MPLLTHLRFLIFQVMELFSQSIWASLWDYGTYHIGDQSLLHSHT